MQDSYLNSILWLNIYRHLSIVIWFKCTYLLLIYSSKICQILWHSVLYSKYNFYDWTPQFRPHFLHHGNHKQVCPFGGTPSAVTPGPVAKQTEGDPNMIANGPRGNSVPTLFQLSNKLISDDARVSTFLANFPFLVNFTFKETYCTVYRTHLNPHCSVICSYCYQKDRWDFCRSTAPVAWPCWHFQPHIIFNACAYFSLVLEWSWGIVGCSDAVLLMSAESSVAMGDKNHLVPSGFCTCALHDHRSWCDALLLWWNGN